MNRIQNLDQILSASTGQSYAWDRNGNSTKAGYRSGPNYQLLEDPQWLNFYDNEGNLVRRVNKTDGKEWHFGYDHLNRLIEAIYWDAPCTDVERETEFTIDVFGNRIEKEIDGTGDGVFENVLRTAYIGSMAWVDLDGSNNVKTRYLSGDVIDQLLARVSSAGTVAWYLTDHLGSIRHIVNNSGSVIDEVTYDPFGTITIETSPALGDRFKFTGREWDAELGQYYYRARMFDPAMMEFTSEDPIGFAAGDPNVGRYVKNSPLTLRDPFGLAPGGGRGPWHDLSVRRDPKKWTEAFRFRQGDLAGHGQWLFDRCRELQKAAPNGVRDLLQLAGGDRTLEGELADIYDWCQSRFPPPQPEPDPAPVPVPVQRPVPEPSPQPNPLQQLLDWIQQNPEKTALIAGTIITVVIIVTPWPDELFLPIIGRALLAGAK